MKYIKKFQKQNGLVPDGIIGKNTIKKMMDVFGIESKTAMAHFLGQVAEETGYFKYGKENLNYSARGLRKIFGRYFTYEQSLEYARQPERIANRVYDDRGVRYNKLGNIYDGDGWKYRGRGALQITGRTKYKQFSKYINDDLINNPELAESKYYWETALWHFESRNIWRYTYSISTNNIRKVTKLVNGGYNGIEHRITLTKHFYDIIKRIK